LALSDDGFAWERLGLVDFSAVGLENEDDKDAAFFPEPVISPGGVLSLAFYHRPMMRLSATQDYQPLALAALALPPCERESIRIAYVPLAAVLEDRRELLAVAESVIVLEPQPEWGHLKTGAGTPPVAVAEGWLSVYHAVDHVPREGDRSARCYSAGLLLHDRERPHLVRYHSAAPIMAPETPDELRGTVNNVVFPTGIDCVPNGPDRCFEIYYGMADSRVGRARIELGASTLARESAA
ncbi:MAG: glycosidase, partial [Vulcanimicrobiaceae bacterium]